jgi:hypothetical protein
MPLSWEKLMKRRLKTCALVFIFAIAANSVSFGFGYLA